MIIKNRFIITMNDILSSYINTNHLNKTLYSRIATQNEFNQTVYNFKRNKKSFGITSLITDNSSRRITKNSSLPNINKTKCQKVNETIDKLLKEPKVKKRLVIIQPYKKEMKSKVDEQYIIKENLFSDSENKKLYKSFSSQLFVMGNSKKRTEFINTVQLIEKNDLKYALLRGNVREDNMNRNKYINYADVTEVEKELFNSKSERLFYPKSKLRKNLSLEHKLKNFKNKNSNIHCTLEEQLKNCEDLLHRTRQFVNIRQRELFKRKLNINKQIFY